MFLRIFIILICISSEFQLVQATDWKKSTRLQIAFGGEQNIFESISKQISDQYIRGFLSQNWMNTTKSANTKINFITWGAIYTKHSIENKYFLKLAAQNAISLKPNVIWRLKGHSQIKKFIRLNHGFWQNYITTGLQYKLSKKVNAKLDGSFENYKFFSNSQFNLSKFAGNLTFIQLLQPQIYIIYGVSLGKVSLPNRYFLRESFDYESQNDQFYSFDLGFNYQKNLFFNGLIHFEKQNSNFSGLDYFLIYSNITFAYKLFQKFFIRSNLRFQIKSYKGGFRPDQMISIDPEVGEGSNGNIDFIYTINKKISAIFRSRLFRQESTFRNKYYSNQIFEIMVELK